MMRVSLERRSCPQYTQLLPNPTVCSQWLIKDPETGKGYRRRHHLRAEIRTLNPALENWDLGMAMNLQRA